MGSLTQSQRFDDIAKRIACRVLLGDFYMFANDLVAEQSIFKRAEETLYETCCALPSVTQEFIDDIVS